MCDTEGKRALAVKLNAFSGLLVISGDRFDSMPLRSSSCAGMLILPQGISYFSLHKFFVSLCPHVEFLHIAI